ncbi:MAG: NAD(P)-dependent oxidoreductase [Candidatus Shapirobacteria bacterium]
MNQLKIGFFGVKSWEREIIEREIINLDATGVGIFGEELQDNIDSANNYDIVSVFVYSKLNKKVLDQLPNLKMIATRSTGIDHIDVGECKKRKIEIFNVPSYGENTVAEYAIALLLAVAKRIVPAHQSVEEGEFSPEGLTGIDIFGKTLGVVGVGKIGQNVIRIAKGLGMKIISVDKGGDLENCLKKSDFVTFHVPATPDTRHLLNMNNIKLMKPGSVLINTSRGKVVKTEAIVYGLANGILWGAGLDVTEDEELVESVAMVSSTRPTKDDLQEVLSYHLLRDRDDVVFTPHNAFNTKEAIGRIIKTTIENINTFCKK